MNGTSVKHVRFFVGLVVALWLSHSAHAGERAHPRVVFENAYVRVSELFAWPGAEGVLLVEPGVVVSLGRARFETKSADGVPSLVDYYPGQILWTGEREQHHWRLLAGEANIFFVEVKSAAKGVVPVPADLDPGHSTLVEPDQHHLVMENAHVRVLDGMAGAGDKSAAHTHPPSVLISLAKSRFKVTINGKTRIFDFEPGRVRWTNHFEHTWQILAGEARVVMIEIKAAHASPEFKRRT